MRLADWQTRLERFIAAHVDARFRYGTWDCCLFVAGAIEAITGQDLAGPFRGTYRSRRQARIAHGRVREIAEHVFHNFLPVPILCAQRGDVVLVNYSGHDLLGILSLNGRSILAVSRRGYVFLNLDLAVKAWTL